MSMVKVMLGGKVKQFKIKAGASMVGRTVALCPKCGATEMHPSKYLLLVRSQKMHDKMGWWSQCLVCDGEMYDASLNETGRSCGGSGWFLEVSNAA